MSDETSGPPPHALSFGGVADAYERARPAYPPEAVAWLVGSSPATVLELGAGTGKLTQQLAARGHTVIATDPSEPMLRRLTARRTTPAAVLATAERIPLGARSVDTVVSAQAFHWFDPARALPEIARVLRLGGTLALVWNLRDERIPWVRRLGRLIGTQELQSDPAPALDASGLFLQVEHHTFRFWQQLTRSSLQDLVRSRSNIAVMSPSERDRVLAEVDALYADYARGSEGLRLPYVTHCYRAQVRETEVRDHGGAVPSDETGTDALLIDFR